jgi:hypothetical protein
MKLGNLVRMATVVAACVAAVGSASSSSQTQPQQPQGAQMNPPPAQDMEAGRSIGLWKSTFGAVKIEADNAHGGLQSGALQGVWQYQRQGQDVVGYFYGTLRGNVLQFHWQEPASPPLTGEGYLVFEQTGRQYSGRWWSDKRDRVGDWNGWRNAAGEPQQQDPQQPQQQYPQPQQQPYPQPPQQQPYPQQQAPQQQAPQQQAPQQQAPQQQYPQQQYPQQQYPQQQYPQQQQQPYPPQRPYYPNPQPQQPQQQPPQPSTPTYY